MKPSVIAVAVAVLSLAGCGNTQPEKAATPETITVAGTLSVLDFASTGDDSACDAGAGFEDVTQGAQVTVRDASSRKVGLGALDEGVLHGNHCVWPFKVTGVPKSTIYSVEIADRGETNFKTTQAGSLELTLNR